MSNKQIDELIDDMDGLFFVHTSSKQISVERHVIMFAEIREAIKQLRKERDDLRKYKEMWDDTTIYEDNEILREALKETQDEIEYSIGNEDNLRLEDADHPRGYGWHRVFQKNKQALNKTKGE